MKWHINETCGNSPKNQMLIEWILAFINKTEPHPFIDDDSIFIYKEKTLALNQVTPPNDIEEIFLEKAITHGKVGAVLGKAIANHSAYPFALFFEFSLGKQPKIKEVQCIFNQH